MADRKNEPQERPGPGVDRVGNPVIDPTRNVLDLVSAAIQRQDDLRAAEANRQEDLRQAESSFRDKMADLRHMYEQELRKAETARIDAIRAVDVGAVNRAAEVSTTQAQTLAASVTASAEALRSQVAAAADAARIALATALEPIQKDIADLRRVQYEQVGQKAQVVETRTDKGEKRLDQGTVIGVVGAGVAIVLLYMRVTGKG